MGIRYIIIGLLFFINPNINIVDILPDCIGAAFIFFGMTKLADISGDLSDAKQSFKRLLVTELVKLALLVTVPIITDAEKTYFLIYVLVFGTLEAVFCIGGIGKLCDGLIYGASRYGGSAPFAGEGDVRTMTVVFFIAKLALTTLPELQYLQITEDGYEDGTFGISLANFQQLFIIANVLLVLVIGIAWFAMIRRYLKRCANDSEFIEGLERHYLEEVAPKTAMFMQRRVKLVFTLLTCAAVFMIDIYFDGELFHGLNILPDFVSAGLLIAALICMKKLLQTDKTALICSAAYGVCALPLWLITTYSAFVFGYTSIYRIQAAYNISLISIVLTVLASAACAMAFWYIGGMLIELVKAYATMEERADLQLEDKNSYIIEHFTKRIRVISGGVIFLGVLSIAERILVHLELFGFFWLINLAATAIWLYFFIKLLGDIRDRIEYSHLFEA